MTGRPIPDDIWEAARSLRSVVLWESNSSVEHIARALMAERERAARIAERDVDWTRFGKGEVHEPWENGPDDARDYRAGIIAGRSIAAAIRGGSQ